MKINCLRLLLASALLTSALAIQAHDPKMHQSESMTPDCAALRGLDLATMDDKDIVMKAVLQKCLQQIHDEESPKRQPQEQHGSDHTEQPQ